MLRVNFVAAIDDKRGIAKKNKIPWDLPSDKKYFKNLLAQGPVVMGWKTYVANGRKPYGPHKNTVLTKDQREADNVEIRHDLQSFFENVQEDTWVGGGGQVFAQALPYATHLYLTRVEGDFACDTFFPEFENEFVLTQEEPPLTENGTTFRYQIWERKH